MVGIALDVWIPMMMQPQLLPGGDRLEARGVRWLEGMARLKGDASIHAAQSELETIGRRLIEGYPRSNEGFTPRVLPLSKSPWGAQLILGPVLTVLTAVVAIVLLLACANVANLLLARALARRREVAIRLAIGASRARLARQFLIESLLLATLGGGAGFVIAWLGAGVLTAFTPPTDIPVKLALGVDAGVLAFTAVLALATGIVFGLAPALQGTRPDVVADLKEEAGSTGGRARTRLRHGLVIVQVSLSLLLLVAAGLFVRSFWNAQQLSPGFNARGVLLAAYEPVPERLRRGGWPPIPSSCPRAGRRPARRVVGRAGTPRAARVRPIAINPNSHRRLCAGRQRVDADRLRRRQRRLLSDDGDPDCGRPGIHSVRR